MQIPRSGLIASRKLSSTKGFTAVDSLTKIRIPIYKMSHLMNQRFI